MEYLRICDVEIRQIKEGEDGDRNAYMTAIVSSGALDSYYTRMTDKTLRNFAADLKRNIQLKDSHRSGQGFGVSTTGKLEDGNVYGDFKLVRELDLNNATYPSSNDFITAIEEKIITRTSVGFSGGTRICGICRTDWTDPSCRHWPGEIYEITDEDGKKRQVTATLDIDDAHLVEVSLVSRGANPDAKIVERAQRHYAQGSLPSRIQRQLEEEYELRFDANLNPKTEVRSMDLERMKEQLDAANATIAERDAKIAELEPLAECGKEARDSVSAEVIEAFKVKNGESVTADQIREAEERNKTLTYSQLVAERNWLVSQAPEKPDVQAGSSTSQPDNSGARGNTPKADSITPQRYERFAMEQRKL